MKIAIFETIETPAGHELDFDRLLVEELQALGHEVAFYVPENYKPKYDYKVPIVFLKGKAITYTGVTGLNKTWRAVQREIQRLRCYRDMSAQAGINGLDAIIVPTASHRYLRSLRYSVLKNSSIPLIFITHGIMPHDREKFSAHCRKLQHLSNINVANIDVSGAESIAGCGNIHPVTPPAYTPRDIILSHGVAHQQGQRLKLGFFGQYRREKNLDSFLDIFASCDFKAPLELVVQGSTVEPEDAADFDRLQKEYAHVPGLRFWHKALIGPEWQQAIADVDALIMPYAAERYRYQPSAMLFTAIGFHKPVVVADCINPEVLAAYDIGVSFRSGDDAALRHALETFVNTYHDKAARYAAALDRANQDFAPRKFAAEIVRLIAEGNEPHYAH